MGSKSTDGLGGAAATELTLALERQRPLIEHVPHAKPCAQHLTQLLTASCKAHLSHLQEDKCHTTQRQVFWVIITTEKLTL